MAKKNQPAEAPAGAPLEGVQSDSGEPAAEAGPKNQPAEALAAGRSLIRFRESVCLSTRAGATVSFLPGATVDASTLHPRDVDWLLEHPEFIEGI